LNCKDKEVSLKIVDFGIQIYLWWNSECEWKVFHIHYVCIMYASSMLYLWSIYTRNIRLLIY